MGLKLTLAYVISVRLLVTRQVVFPWMQIATKKEE